MSEADFYPAGAYLDPNAPYNEVEVPERDFNVSISQSLSKDTTITTTQYVPEYDEEDGHTYANTDDTDWTKAYLECAYDPIGIIEACKKIAEYLRDNGTFRVGSIHLKTLIDNCENWVVNETTVIEE